MKDNINNNKKRKKMKKYLMTVVAALAAASFTSCSNEMDMFDPISSDKATIDLNVTNNVLMYTRADGDVEATNPAGWYITVGTGTTSSQIPVSQLSTEKYTPGTGYTVTASSHADLAAAITANAAYYEGTVTNVELKTGKNQINIACGKAKNCRVKVNLSGLSAFDKITNAKLTFTQGSTSRELDGTETKTTGYFLAVENNSDTSKDISYSLAYSYYDSPMTPITGSISKPAAATEYQISVTTNDTGSITLKVTYNTQFNKVVTDEITIDAATGGKKTS